VILDRDRGGSYLAGVIGAIAGFGAAIGLLLGGLLTECLSWRWVMFVNLGFAVPAIIAAVGLLHHETPSIRPRIDIPGTITATAGLFARGAPVDLSPLEGLRRAARSTAAGDR
jgi:MFS family permease